MTSKRTLCERGARLTRDQPLHAGGAGEKAGLPYLDLDVLCRSVHVRSNLREVRVNSDVVVQSQPAKRRKIARHRRSSVKQEARPNRLGGGNARPLHKLERRKKRKGDSYCTSALSLRSCLNSMFMSAVFSILLPDSGSVDLSLYTRYTVDGWQHDSISIYVKLQMASGAVLRS